MKPIRRANPLHGVQCEIISAISALNSTPEPIAGETEHGYLSETDYMVKHAMEHLDMAMEESNRISSQLQFYDLFIFSFFKVLDFLEKLEPKPQDLIDQFRKNLDKYWEMKDENRISDD